MPHSIVKFWPLEVTIVLLEAGQDTPVGDEPEPADVAVEPLVIAVLLDGVHEGS